MKFLKNLAEKSGSAVVIVCWIGGVVALGLYGESGLAYVAMGALISAGGVLIHLVRRMKD